MILVIGDTTVPFDWRQFVSSIKQRLEVRSPFNILRACFYLFGVVVLLEAAWATVGGIGCLMLIMNGTIAIGSCAEVAQRAREIFSEMLAGILALLLAARPPSDKPPRQEDK